MNIPDHVAIILDGNGRWAKAKGMPRSYGHMKGCANLEYLTLTNLLIRAGDNAFAGCNALKQIRIADLSNQFEPKVQLKIHRNFYQVLLGIREDIAAEYARKYGIQ